MAVAAFTKQEKLDLILIKSGLFNQPIVCCDRQRNIQISIAHCDNVGVAAVFWKTTLWE